MKRNPPSAGSPRKAWAGTKRRLHRALLLGALLVLGSDLTGCALSSTYMRPERIAPGGPPAPDSIDASLLLIGDAGWPVLETPDPVLQALQREAAQLPTRTTVVFLGDNIYPRGLPEEHSNARQRSESILRLQMDAVLDSGARGIFIPGNHDYGAQQRDALTRQAALLAESGNGAIEMLPGDGCPGPAVVDLGQHLRIVLLDSVWWLFKEADRARPPQCDTNSEEIVLAKLKNALAQAGNRHSIVLLHHPIATHGPHGGFFTWDQHVFPLRELHSWLWVPLPVLGSAYPLWRRNGFVVQDLSHARYQHLIARLEETFRRQPPLALAAGHEHTLQVLDTQHNVGTLLVTGAGSTRKRERSTRKDDTLFASPHAGFMRLDALRDGRVRLTVIEVPEEGELRREFSMWLEPALGKKAPQAP